LGLLIGTALGLVGTALGVVSLFYALPSLFVIATLFFGMSMGIGFYLRFAVMEAVPDRWTSKAAALVVSGGVFGAFAGPQSGSGTTGIFGAEQHLKYLGPVVMTGVFNLLNAMFVALLQFRPPPTVSQPRQGECHSVRPQRHTLWAVLKSRAFIVPVLISALSWAVMAIPMSLVIQAMYHVKYPMQYGVLNMELHFVGMYAPGIVTGSLIRRYGARAICTVAAILFVVSDIILQAFVSDTFDVPGNGVLAAWLIGMIVIGVAWNLGFTGSTVWVTKAYETAPELTAPVQAANECLMFLISGLLIFAGSFLYAKTGGGLNGWHSIMWVVVGLTVVYIAVLAVDFALERRCSCATSPLMTTNTSARQKENDAQKETNAAEDIV